MFKQIGKNIKFLRKRLKLSQNDLAKKLSMTRQQIANYEKGDTSIPFASIYMMSEIFNISLDDFISNNLQHSFILDDENVEEKKILEINQIKSLKSTDKPELFLLKNNVKVSHKEIVSYFIMNFDTFMENELIKLKVSNLVKDGVIDYLEKNVKSRK
jgi:transcriptional regulator with XRE-family HTH domain